MLPGLGTTITRWRQRSGNARGDDGRHERAQIGAFQRPAAQAGLALRGQSRAALQRVQCHSWSRGDAVATLLETLGELIGANWKQREVVKRHSRTFSCSCGNHVFFRNTLCLGCQAPLGYLPGDARLAPLDPGPRPGTWVAEGGRSPKKYCGNREMPARCNWMLAADDPNPLCIACRLNRTIPNLDDADNARSWGRIEIAKRRLVSELLALGLPVKSKVDELARSIGQPDFYPFVMSKPMVAKLQFVHLVVQDASSATTAS
jgi:zinc-ribbon domain/Putative zinc-binding metallo-peptidase